MHRKAPVPNFQDDCVSLDPGAEKRSLSSGGSPIPHRGFPAAAPVGGRRPRHFAVPLRVGSLLHSWGKREGDP